MLVTFSALQWYRGAVSLVDGCFDPLHAGHVSYFQAAAALGRPLLCHVASDEYVRTKHQLLVPHQQRVTVIHALRDVAFTHVNEYDTEAVLEQLRPCFYVKGRDWEGRLPTRQVALCNRLGIRMVFLDTVHESSTRLLQARAARGAAPTSTTPHPDPTSQAAPPETSPIR